MNLLEIGNALGPWVQLLSLLGAWLAAAGTGALWILVRKFVPRQECEACRTECQKQMNARLGKQEASSGELSAAVAQAAPKDKLAEVDKADETLKGEIKALAATIQGLQEQQRALSKQVTLLMQHHLGGARS